MPVLFCISEQVFYFLHSFPRNASLKCRAEWCFSFFLLSGFQPWSGSSLLCACPPSMLTNHQQGSCFANSIKDPLLPVSLSAVEGQPGLVEHHVPSPVHDSPAFIFFKPSSLGELLPPRYMLFLVFIAAWWSKMTASAGDELLASIIACILRLCHQWSMGSLAPAKCTAQAVCSAAHPNSASNIWIPVHVPWTGQEEEPLGETKAKNGEKNEKEGHKAGAKVGLVPGELRTSCAQPCVQNASCAKLFFS